MTVSVQDLETVTDFQGVPKEELGWLAENLSLRELGKGEPYYRQGEPADTLQVVLAGTIELVRHEGGKEVASFLLEPGEVSGRLPFSRMEAYGASATALAPSRVAELSTSLFPALHERAPVLLQRLVYEMLDRTREYTRLGAQREKLMSLGTMSAGLAHELNNPAAAAKRAAQSLQETLQAFDEHSSKILSPVMFKETHDGDPFGPIYEAVTLNGDTLGTLERSDREDELGEWLEGRGVARAWEVAATLVAGGVTLQALAQVADDLKPEQVKNFLEWLPRDVEMRLLAQELTEATSRISELVGAMKAYSYMDQGLEKGTVDLHEGLRNTLTILKHKFAKKNIRVVKEFGEVPPLPAYGSELNQVWTNLLSNAVDAVDEGGTVTLRTGVDPSAAVACVDVIDDGGGVPEEIRDRIFEPFFTTKGVGEGTGMGLDIANRIVRQRHRGTLQLESAPGATRFSVRLPLS